MKIKLFIWLVHQRKILTWDNLLKKVFAGPSKFYLCGSQEEMMDHLLNLCPFTSTMWEWVASIFTHTDSDRLSISNALKNWRKKFSRSEIINKSWNLVRGFFIWDVWKERNSWIFKNKARKPQHIIDKF